jgi:hypothetical protein
MANIPQLLNRLSSDLRQQLKCAINTKPPLNGVASEPHDDKDIEVWYLLLAPVAGYLEQDELTL